MRYAALCLLVLLFLPPAIRGQNLMLADTLDNLIIYSNEKSGLVQAHSNGIGIGYRTGVNRSILTTRSWAFDFVSLQSPKQVKTINPYYTNSRRYVYGKLNDVFVLRAGISEKYLLNRKPYWGGVEVRWLWETGASMAFEKPYYLFVIRLVPGPGGNLSYTIDTEKFNSDVSWDDIYGKAPFTRGIDEIKLRPGAYGKLGFNFEFGNVRTATRAVEVGVAADVHPFGVSIMQGQANQRFFLNFYLSYAMGKRFNKY
ncbi:MAG: hypothetical protein IPM52_02095 [Bacteroidetes bacterium]|nr:hypothetical protein [Bacteroidota bacterium]